MIAMMQVGISSLGVDGGVQKKNSHKIYLTKPICGAKKNSASADNP